MKILKKIRKKVNSSLELFASILLAIMLVIVTADVFCRYVLKFSFRWTEEISLILLIWFCFITMSIGVKNHLHLRIEMFIRKFPDSVKLVLMKISEVLTLTVSVLLAIFGWKLVNSSMRSTLPATGFPTGVLYFIIPIIGVVMACNSLYDLIAGQKPDDDEKLDAEGRDPE